MNPLLTDFIESTSASFVRRVSPLHAPQIPGDLREFLECFEAGDFHWFDDEYVLQSDPFSHNLNVHVSLRDIVPLRGRGDAFRGYDECYVLFDFNWEPQGPDDTTNLCFDIPKVSLGVDLSGDNFGWIFLYCTEEFEAQLSKNATYVAKSWSDFMTLVIENRNDFEGAPFWSPQNKVIPDGDANQYYVPELPVAK